MQQKGKHSFIMAGALALAAAAAAPIQAVRGGIDLDKPRAPKPVRNAKYPGTPRRLRRGRIVSMRVPQAPDHEMRKRQKKAGQPLHWPPPTSVGTLTSSQIEVLSGDADMRSTKNRSVLRKLVRRGLLERRPVLNRHGQPLQGRYTYHDTPLGTRTAKAHTVQS